MCSAAKAIGNTELENKFAEGDESSPNIWQEKYSFIWEEFTSRAPASHLEMFVSDDDMLARCEKSKHVSSGQYFTVIG